MSSTRDVFDPTGWGGMVDPLVGAQFETAAGARYQIVNVSVVDGGRPLLYCDVQYADGRPAELPLARVLDDDHVGYPAPGSADGIAGAPCKRPESHPIVVTDAGDPEESLLKSQCRYCGCSALTLWEAAGHGEPADYVLEQLDEDNADRIDD